MKYYLVGIKGSGMASLAHILVDLGHEVSGSDIDQHIFTQDSLEKRGIIINSFNKNNIEKDMIIIRGNAFDESNEEIKQANLMGLNIYSYVWMLQKLIEDYTTICIAGTHGKTSTTGLVEKVLEEKEKTGYLIGDGHGKLNNQDINFVVESCEYQDNFLNYYPNIVLINNIEYDHVDYFKTLKQYIASFEKFALHAKDYVVINGDDSNCLSIEKQDNFYYFGLNDFNDFQAKNICLDEDGIHFDLYSNFKCKDKVFKHSFNIKLYGKHMLMNILATIVIYCLKIGDEDYDYLEKQFNSYQGVDRRFSIIEENTNVFIDDYAHHPTAISLMIDTARQKYPGKKVIAFFKPDRYSRINEFKNEIARALNKADEVYLFEFPNTSTKEAGIDIDMSYVLHEMNKGKIIEEDDKSLELFANYRDCIFLMMSSKNVYDYQRRLIAFLKGDNI